MKKKNRSLKQFLTLVLAAAFTALLAYLPAYAEEIPPEQFAGEGEAGVIGVVSWNGLQAAFDGAGTDKDNPTRIALSGNLTCGESGTNLTVPQNKYVVLDLNGHTIDRGLGSSYYEPSKPEYGRNVITVSGNLTLADSSDDPETPDYDGSGRITGGCGYPAGGVWVKENACFIMQGGNITGNIEKPDYSNHAGGVLVDERAVFIMEGGTINNNKCDDGAGGAGGVFVRGYFTMSGNSSITANNKNKEGAGGVKVLGEASSFIMNGGTIEDNYSSDGKGGGVDLYNGAAFTMNGGTISGNGTTGSILNCGGGGVRIDGGTFTMNDGAINNNASTSTGLRFSGGGGVYVSSGTFMMNGGMINGNTADTGNGDLCGGGGVYVNSTFTMTGGTIRGNNVSGEASTGGGVFVYCDGAEFNVSGTPVITDNVKNGEKNDGVYAGDTPNNVGLYYFNEQHKGIISVTGKLENGAGIWVNSKSDTIATGGGYTINENDVKCFRSEDDSRVVLQDGNDIILVSPESWRVLRSRFQNAEGTKEAPTVITLDRDYRAAADDRYLYIPWGKYVILDLAGYTLDFAPADESDDGCVIRVAGNLILKDSSDDQRTPEYDGTGIITGGRGYHMYVSMDDRKYVGGGVLVNPGSTFEMRGGRICGNKADLGGGVSVVDSNGIGDSGTFIMRGGMISGNTAAEKGGGVYIGGGQNQKKGGVFSMTGGTISGNTAGAAGGAVFVKGDGTFNVSGAPFIYGNKKDETPNNVYLDGESYISVAGALTEGAKIGICGRNVNEAVAQAGGEYELTFFDAACFLSDDGDSLIAVAEGNSILFKKRLPEVRLDPASGDYTGKAHTITVKAGDDIFDEDNYTVRLTNSANEIVSEMKDAGKYKVTITGRGEYTGVSPEMVYTINKVDPIVEVTGANGLSYDGSEQALVASATVSGGALSYAVKETEGGEPSDDEYKAAAPAGKDAGTYYVWYRVEEDKNHNHSDPGCVEVTIGKGKLQEPAGIERTYKYLQANSDEVELKGLPEDCGQVSFKELTTSGNLVFSKGPAVSETGVLSYSLQQGKIGDSGTIQVVAEMQNYKDVTFTVDITLVDQTRVKPRQNVTLKNSVLTYGQELSALEFDPVVFVSDDESSLTVEGRLDWVSPNAVPDAGTKSAGWIFTPADPRYAPLSGDISITVNKAASKVTVSPEASEITYGQTLAGSVLTGGAARADSGPHKDEALEGSFAWKDPTVHPAVSDSNKTEYEVTFTPAQALNFEASSCRVTLSVNKAEIDEKYITPPKAEEGLKYNGKVQALVSSGSVSGNIGTMLYALTVSGAEAPADSAYTEEIPKAIDAGGYTVWYMVQGGANYKNTAPKGISVHVEKAGHDHVDISGEARYGTAGMLELRDYIAEGGLFSIKETKDDSHVLSGNEVLDGTLLRWSFKDDSSLGNKTATVVISVSNAKNYNDYELTVTLTVNDCLHSRTELRDVRPGTCSAEGYSGDRYCSDCGALIEKGSATDKDPDNHHFDFNDAGHKKVKQEATLLQMGITTYTCVWCGNATMDRTDIPCLPDEKGRDLVELREDVADLSGNAVPVIDEKKDDKGNTVEETVTIGGEEVSKIITDPESGKETVESKVWIGGLKDSCRYTGSAQKPSFHVYDGMRKLKENTDYTVSWKNNKNAGTAAAIVKFKGNYKDAKSETVSFKIDAAVLGEDIIAHEIGVAAKKKGSVKVSPVLTWAETGKAVSSKYFSITPSSVPGEGTTNATITPKSGQNNYTGSATVLIKAVGDKNKVLSNAKVKFDPKSYNYTGKPIEPKYSLTMGTTTLTENKDYKRVSLTGNTDPGTATIIFEAISGNAAGYVGSKTATFKITGKIGLKEGAPFEYSYAESVPYAKGGAKPAVTVKYDGVTLKEGTDYTLSYSKNKAVTNGEKTAKVTVKGKGNYKGSVKLKYAIGQQSLKASGITVMAADQFAARSKLKAPKITITDADGKKLKANTDFTAGTDYAYTGDDASGTVTVTVTGKGNYKDEVPASYRYTQSASANIAKAKANRIGDQPYTGNPVKLSANDLKDILYAGKKSSKTYLVPGRDFVAAGYSNNVKKGSAKVTVQGIGAYAGTKTITFKIVQKKVDYKGALIGGEWQKTQ